MSARTRGLPVTLDNIGTAKNVLSIAEGGLLNIGDILITVKEKVTQAASDTLSSTERNAIKTEIDQLTEEIDSIVSETTFNGRMLIDGTFTGVSIRTGEKPTNTLRINLSQNVGTSGIGVTSTEVSQKVFTASGSSSALAKVDLALVKVNGLLQEVGAISSRLTVKEHTVETSIINTKAARSRIIDADFARLQLESIRYIILQRTSSAALAQANLLPFSILTLFNR